MKGVATGVPEGLSLIIDHEAWEMMNLVLSVRSSVPPLTAELNPWTYPKVPEALELKST